LNGSFEGKSGAGLGRKGKEGRGPSNDDGKVASAQKGSAEDKKNAFVLEISAKVRTFAPRLRDSRGQARSLSANGKKS